MKMKYALVNGERQEAQKGVAGMCQCCNSPVIAKCGEVRVKHWAHKAKLECDPWWENKTEWHRVWQEQFPEKYREVVHTAANGEKHIADVKIDQGYVVEFQHSPIKPEERQAREDFYKGMIWVVDGMKRPEDKLKFINVWKGSILINEKVEIWKLRGFDGCPLLLDWGSSNAPVFFDFSEEALLGILPKDPSGERYGVAIDRKALIASLYPAQQDKSFKKLLYGWICSIPTAQPKKEIAPPPQNFQPRYWIRRGDRRRF